MGKFAVIGVGRIGTTHARNLFKRKIKSGACLEAVCDIDEKRLKELKEKFKGVATYSDYRQMLEKEDIDAVIISTPHYFHAEIAKACLEAGKHVLVEKPVTVTAKEAAELNKFAEKYPNQIFAVMYNQRTNPLYAKAKQLIESGEIGKIQRVNFIITNWYRTQYYYDLGGWRASWSGEGGGTLINQCIHQIDILQWLTGLPKKIYAVCETKERKITTENEVTAILSYVDYKCSFSASTRELPGTNRLEIAGDKGRIIISGSKMTYTLCEKSEKQVNKNANRDYGNSKDKKSKTYTKSYGTIRLLKEALRFGQQANVLDKFAKAIEMGNKELLVAKGYEGINALEIINAMNMSSWLGKEVNLPVDKDEYEKMLKDKVAQEGFN